MIIRPAQVADVPAVLPMVAKVCAFHERIAPAKYSFLPNIAARYDRWLQARSQDPRSAFFVAEREAAGDQPALLVGFIVGTVEEEIPIYRIDEFGFIHDLWVDEAYRHEGIGRQLVTMAIEKFTQIGVPQIRLDTAAANDAARELFESCGFTPSTTEMLLEVKEQKP